MLPPRSSTLFPYTTLFRSLTVSHALQVKFLFRGQFERGYGTGHKSRITDRDCYCKLFKLQDTRILGETRSEEHTSELQSRGHLVCRLLLEKKKQPLERPST